MKDVILGRYAHSAVLVGISAGAIQLGRYGIVETPESPATELLEVFRLVPWSSTRTTSEPSGRGYRARFIYWRQRPPGSESPPVAESSCTRIPPSSLCGVPRTNSVSRALASRTHCWALKRATDSFGPAGKPLNGLELCGGRDSNPRPTDQRPTVRGGCQLIPCCCRS